ncbi:hypothetical protein F5Y10DRAFT_81771 [Nemania abortiva]|nr:hypothetical protein F5Y10DRAFT_81771 [Nemania abortiva]
MKGNSEYEPLPNDAGAEVPPTRRRKEQWNILSFSIGCATAFALSAIFLTLRGVLSVPKTAAEIEAEEWNYCGRSSDIARARGCKMEPMFYGWMPAKCVFDELTQSLPIFEDRKYYSDRNMTQELLPEQLWAGEYKLAYTSRYHDEHCLFQWRKLQYAMANRMDFVDNKTMSLGHTNHCADQLSESCEPKTGGVAEIELGFYRCRKTIW